MKAEKDSKTERDSPHEKKRKKSTMMIKNCISPFFLKKT